MAGTIPYISDAQFQKEVLDSNVPVLLDFTAAWCGPCQALAPHLEAVQAAKGAGLKVLKLDIDNNPETPNRFGVMNIPTLLIFKGGQVASKQVGSLNRVNLEKWVNGVVG